MTKRILPTRTLPERPDLRQLKRQAKELQRQRPKSTLHDAQFELARSYGFESWPKLKAFVDGVTVRRLADAVRAGDLRQVRQMLKARPELVNYDQAENNEHHAIHYAVFARNLEMVRLLMEFGADARSGIYPHRPATRALTVARERGYDEIVAAIEEAEAKRRGVATSAPDALTEAIAEGEEDRAIAMLEGDPSLARAKNCKGWTQLHVASEQGSEKVAAWLLEQGADVNARGPQKDLRPIDVAATRSMAVLLRSAGASMTPRAAVILGDLEWLRDHWEDTGDLLTLAVEHDRPEILRMLLDFGLDPNEPTRLEGLEETVWSKGQPLWTCAREGKVEMARLLLDRGADPNVHVYASGPAMHVAFERGDAEMLALLEAHGGVVPPVTVGLLKDRERAARMLADEAAGRTLPPGILEGRNVSEDLLRGSADSGDVEIVRMSLPGVDWAPSDDRWYWILLQAVWSGNPEGVRLVAARCDVTMRHPRFGRTILHDVAGLGAANVAAASGEIAAVLLDAGARMDERDDVLRSTPLGWACRWGRIEMVRMLLARCADPVEADAEDWARPRAWAQKMGHVAVLELLDG